MSHKLICFEGQVQSNSVNFSQFHFHGLSNVEIHNNSYIYSFLLRTEVLSEEILQT